MRQFISPRNPDKNGLILLTGKDFHYLRDVLRLKSGDMLQVRLLDGTLLNTTVCETSNSQKTILLQVCAQCNGDGERTAVSNVVETQTAKTEFYLFQFIAKAQKMELIIRQATECGVKCVVPVIGEYSQKGNVLAMNNAKQERFQKIVREAMQQSGSAIQTHILSPLRLNEALDFWKREHTETDSLGIALWERDEKSHTIKETLSHFTNSIENEKKCRKIKKACIVVGCEGGISPDEMAVLQQSGFIPVHFSTNILRCETAALYGIAALQSAIFEENYGCAEN
ncbi:MAG: 16S rRNA (uracil(1498)-N(3))-methyltransferase [Treponema sp.]|nr:16S rRNA (uracil(1498)-N(3))-methyltransferase [Treponema sp.]